jgi:hypothetical protein
MNAARTRKTMGFLGGVLVPVLLLTLMGPAFLTGSAGARSALHAQDFPEEGTDAPAGGAGDGSEAQAPGDQGQTGPGAVDENSIFDSQSFDKQIEQSVASEKETKLEKQLGGQVLFSNDLLVPMDFEYYTVSSRFLGTVFGKLTYPDVASLYLSYNFLSDIFRYSSRAGAEPLDSSLFDIQAELAEFFIDFDVYKKVFIRMGNQLIAWGPSFFWTPVDFINLERFNPLAKIDLRVGKPGLRVHVPIKKTNLFTFFDFSESLDENNAPRGIGEALRAGLRYDFVLLGYEMGLSTYFGEGVRTLAGFDFSGVFLRSDFYGEFAFSDGSNTQKAVPSTTPGEYDLEYTYDFVYSFVVGMQKSFGEFKYWTAGGELYFNSYGYGADPPVDFLLQNGLFNPIYTGKFYLFFSLKKSNLWGNQNITGSVACVTNVSDLSFDAYTTLGFLFPRLIPIDLKLDYLGGPSGKTFTPGGPDSMLLSVFTKVSF